MAAVFTTLHATFSFPNANSNMSHYSLLPVITIVEGADTDECVTTKKADIAFVLDASGSVRKSNFIRMLEFVVKIIESFEIGKEKVQFCNI